MGTDKLTLVLMAGLPGVGKTKLAEALQDKLGWQVIDKDSFIMKNLCRMKNLHIIDILHRMKMKRRSLDEYLAAWFAYKQSFNEVYMALNEHHSSVILDSAALHQFILSEALEIVSNLPNPRLKVIHCVANHALRTEHLLTRSGYHPKPWIDPNTDVDEAQLFKHLPLSRLILDMSESFEENIDKVIEYLLS